MKNINMKKTNKTKKSDGTRSGISISQRISELAYRAIGILFVVMMLGILSCCIFLYKMNYACDWRGRNLIPAFLLIPVGLTFLIGIRTAIEKIGQMVSVDRTVDTEKYVKYAAILLFIVQVYSVKTYYFYTGWDVWTVTDFAAALAHGEDVSWYGYFSTYPNNLLLALLFSFIEKAVHALGLHDLEYAALLVMQCAIVSVTGVLTFRIVKLLTNRESMAWMGYILYILLIGTSPWVVIPYSDATGLLLPVLILWLYLNHRKYKHTAVTWGILAALAVIGYRVKPQIVILLIAIGMIELLNSIGKKKWNGKAICGAILGIVLAGMFTNLVITCAPLELNSEAKFGIPHFFMMGLNEERMGVWAEEDVIFSGSFATSAERNQADLERAVDRIRTMGPAGLIKHGVRKTLTNYYDGTFAWAVEGNFFRIVPEEKKIPLSDLFRSLYYTGDYAETGKYHWTWANVEQMLWMTVLFLSVFCSQRKHENTRVVMLGILGLTLFELLFEARARYLYTYVPLYITLACCGFETLREKIHA